ncbi:acetoacetate decarboxylase family protein [Nonomuraea ceibae]|uniref:acetoacetate decarboxylase family protein n=1 Tax=Nonomuraea ceibae TaxID=1935170 RepID=UPI001C5F165E|nr:acetoacetate decarboxylase family protein [Nonomuraea ceibae]
MASHLIQGRTVGMPVRIRDVAVCAAAYAVRADAARAVIAYSGLDAAEVLPGKAVCVLLFADYRDGDLDAYHEFGMAFVIRRPDTGRAGLFVHWLPVDGRFTLEAGRALWGFPKELADIDLRLSSPYKRCILRKDGRLVLDLLVRPGVPVAGPGLALDAFTHRDGVTRRVPWRFRARGVRVRPGGALIRLGNHPIAKELSELGLPRRPLLTATAAHATVSLDDAQTLP